MPILILTSLMISATLTVPVWATDDELKTLWLDEIDLTRTVCGWQKPRANLSVEGNPLTVGGKPYSRGVGTHANARIVLELDGRCERFVALVGVDDEILGSGKDRASISFVVLVDGQEVWSSGIMKAGQAALSLDVVLSGAKSVELRVEDGGDGYSYDHANFLDARFLYRGEVPKSPSEDYRFELASGGQEPEVALSRLRVPDDLEVTCFAHEPMLLSPSNIDIDSRGRAWVCEVVNYRGRNGMRAEGDRILILEDRDGDGRADHRVVYFQGPEVDSALGICVLSERVIVSAGDRVLVFYDDDGDDRADRHESLFTGIQGVQHDHGIHAFVFGPDGRYYFNFGNEGKRLLDQGGDPVLDLRGNVVDASRNPYQEGMVFRCEPDGSRLETLAWNFRNNYEVAVDSFGELFQSDNDDDGNRAVRINFVMEGGNYGFRDERSGAGWRTSRTGMAEDVPSRHWHTRDPGVIPNLLLTGAGSPTGIVVYEGDLLPERYRGHLIHTDAGPNVVRSYRLEIDGGGYRAAIQPVVDGRGDSWFRPSDVAVAPDGSLFIADWYDPGVGGHGMGDVGGGRLYRVAPKDTPYRIPRVDVSNVIGAVSSLMSPNLATRALAYEALMGFDQDAVEPLRTLFGAGQPHHRARALWVLARLERDGQTLGAAFSDPDDRFRAQALRVTRALGKDVLGAVERLSRDPSARVRRACAIALGDLAGDAKADVWATLAAQHVAGERWSLEALGIGARGAEDACLRAWLDLVGPRWRDPEGRDILWRSRSSLALPRIVEILGEDSLIGDEARRFLRSLDFHEGDVLGQSLRLIADTIVGKPADLLRDEILQEVSLRMPEESISPEARVRLSESLAREVGSERYLRLVEHFDLREEFENLITFALGEATPTSRVACLKLAVRFDRQAIAERLNRDADAAIRLMALLAYVPEPYAILWIEQTLGDASFPPDVHNAAIDALLQTLSGQKKLVTMIGKETLKESHQTRARSGLLLSHHEEIREFMGTTLGTRALPADLLQRTGDATNGAAVYKDHCALCHRMRGAGHDFGPDLTEISTKLSPEGLLQAIVEPDAAVSFGYETTEIVTRGGMEQRGILHEGARGRLRMSFPGGVEIDYIKGEIRERRKVEGSSMPNLLPVLSDRDLVDVLAFLRDPGVAPAPKAGAVPDPSDMTPEELGNLIVHVTWMTLLGAFLGLAGLIWALTRRQ